MSISHRRGSSQASQTCPVCGCGGDTVEGAKNDFKPAKRGVSQPRPARKRGRRGEGALNQNLLGKPEAETGQPSAERGRKLNARHPNTTSARRPYGRRQSEHFEEILLAMRRETLNDLRNYEEALRNLTDNVSGDTYDDDVAIQLNASFEASSLEELTGLSNRQRKLLSHIDAALERIKNGIYGLCRSCGHRILWERLEAVPHATLCLVCKTGRAA